MPFYKNPRGDTQWFNSAADVPQGEGWVNADAASNGTGGSAGTVDNGVRGDNPWSALAKRPISLPDYLAPEVWGYQNQFFQTKDSMGLPGRATQSWLYGNKAPRYNFARTLQSAQQPAQQSPSQPSGGLLGGSIQPTSPTQQSPAPAPSGGVYGGGGAPAPAAQPAMTPNPFQNIAAGLNNLPGPYELPPPTPAPPGAMDAVQNVAQGLLGGAPKAMPNASTPAGQAQANNMWRDPYNDVSGTLSQGLTPYLSMQQAQQVARPDLTNAAAIQAYINQTGLNPYPQGQSQWGTVPNQPNYQGTNPRDFYPAVQSFLWPGGVPWANASGAK